MARARTVITDFRKRLRETDRRISNCNARVALYQHRLAARSRNSALAEQAEQLLSVAVHHLRELRTYRQRLAHALEMEPYLSSYEHIAPGEPPRLPRHMR